MSKCLKCEVEVNSVNNRCPLCNSELKKWNKEDSIYPNKVNILNHALVKKIILLIYGRHLDAQFSFLQKFDNLSNLWYTIYRKLKSPDSNTTMDLTFNLDNLTTGSAFSK